MTHAGEPARPRSPARAGGRASTLSFAWAVLALSGVGLAGSLYLSLRLGLLDLLPGRRARVSEGGQACMV